MGWVKSGLLKFKPSPKNVFRPDLDPDPIESPKKNQAELFLKLDPACQACQLC